MAEMITGARNGGAVRHYGHTHVSLCGRYMVVGKGDSLRDCLSCVRIGKLVTVNNASDLELLAATRYNGSVDHVRMVVAKGRSMAQLTFIRSILSDDTSDLDPAIHALYMLIVDKGASNGEIGGMYRDPATRKGGGNGGNVIDPKNAKPARSILTERQSAALNKMSAFENALIKEIRELEGKECPDLELIDLSKLKTRKDIDSAFTSLSASLDKLKSHRDTLKREQRVSAPKAQGAVITVGMYQVGERVFKVKPTQAGKLWAHELVGSTEDGFHFEFAGNPSRFVKPEQRMTLEEAKRFGQITGTCCVCSAMLTDEKSIAEGIGPVCASKF